MIEDALSFPRNSDDWLRTIVIGTLLGFFSFLIVPGLIIQGYLLRAARAAADGQQRPPDFSDWGELLVDGVKAFVVAFVYGIVPAVIVVGVLSVLAGGAALSAFSGDPGAAAGFGIAIAAFVLLALPLLIVIGYLTVVAQLHFAITGDLGAAFRLGEVVRIGFDLDFFVAFLLALVVGIALSVVGGILVVVLVGFLVFFYAGVVMFYIYGRGYADATGRAAEADSLVE